MTDVLQPHPPPEAENWDDDFVFQSPGDDAAHANDAPVRRSLVGTQRDSGAWDDDEDFLHPVKPVPRPGKEPEDVHWGDSDDEGQHRHGLRAGPSLLSPDPSPSKWTDDADDEFAPGSYDVDRTVTLKDRTSMTFPCAQKNASFVGAASAMSSSASLQSSSQQHVHLPPSHNRYSPTPYSPNSPTISSAFSMGASSTAHLALRSPKSTVNTLPPMAYQPPPQQRPRRRLRKKSRPPTADIFELEDTQDFLEELEERAGPSAPNPTSSSRPSTTESASAQRPPSRLRGSSLSRQQDQSQAGTYMPSAPSSPSAKPALLSRLGSMKNNWTNRRKLRTPSQSNIAAAAETPMTPPRDPSPAAGLDLQLGRARSPEPISESDVSRRGSISRQSQASGSRQGIGKVLSRFASASNISPAGNRPMSMVQNSTVPSRPSTMQHAATVGRSTSNPFVALPIEPSSSSGSIFGMKKRGHKRTKSSGADSVMSNGPKDQSVRDQPPLPPLPLQPDSPAKPPSTPPRVSDKPPVLPPIELSPPSPPRLFGSASQPAHSSFQHLTSAFASPTRSSPGGTSSLGRANGIAVIAGATGPTFGSMRRNSLGDLKIPARISRAQVGLKNNLTMVREFAANVELLKELQTSYKDLVGDFHRSMQQGRTASANHVFDQDGRSTPGATVREASNKGMMTDLKRIDDQYALWWECAELLVELGGGKQDMGAELSASTSQTIAPPQPPPRERERAITLAGGSAAPTPTDAFPPWRSSEGKAGLSQRQLALLKEMLTTPDPSTLALPDYPPLRREVTTVGGPLQHSQLRRPFHPASSCITLPESTTSSSAPRSRGNPSTSDFTHAPISPKPSEGKLRRASRAGFMSIKDILRTLKKAAPPPPPVPAMDVTMSQTARSGEKDGLPPPPSAQVAGQKRPAKSSTGAHSANGDENRMPPPPPASQQARPFASQANRKSPRRPSLASLFRLGGGAGSRRKSNARNAPPLPGNSSSAAETNTTTEDDMSDWDRMDSASDIDIPMAADDKAANQATVKGKKSLIPRSPPPQVPQPYPILPSASHSSLSLRDSPLKRPARLPTAITEEAGRTPAAKGRSASHSNSRPPSRGPRVRQITNSSLPPLPFSSLLEHSTKSTPGETNFQRSPRPSMDLDQPIKPDPMPVTTAADVRLALTPENIRPLLECSREVSARLSDCVTELRNLASTPSISMSTP